MSKALKRKEGAPHPLSIEAQQRKGNNHLVSRHRRAWLFRNAGLLSILLSFAFLVILFVQIGSNATGAFRQTTVTMPVYFDPALIDVNEPGRGKYLQVLYQSMDGLFPYVFERREKRQLYRLISRSYSHDLREMVVANPQLIGQTKTLPILASTDIDMLMKGRIKRETPEHKRKIKDQHFVWIDKLLQEDRLKTSWNVDFFRKGDSRQPEQAGLLGALVGSFFTLIVCMLICFPIAVGAAIYLEEFAPKNKFTDLIEVNINNLAAVPSIVFGLLALAIYLHWWGMPRSSALVGGMALSMLVLPTIVITTRNALKAVPPSIRDAARGLGASDVQTLFHHTLPLAMPGVMTGSILAMARALGETAPLLMIGMVAFVADVPGNLNDPATALPVQIYLWADSPEIAFKEKTSAAIMVLIALLVLLNGVAATIRKKFETKW